MTTAAWQCPGRRTVIGAVLLTAAISVPCAQEFECLVEPYREVKLGSTLPGILDEVRVERGDVVKEDQVVATLESDVERAHYELVKARAEFAARRVERNEELYLKQMISIHEKDELETEAQLLKLEVREVEERLKLRTITSPINGVVVKRHFHPGEYVQDDTILELAQVDPLRVEVVIPANLYGRIRIGMTGQVRWATPPGETHPAEVTVVDPVLDAASATIGVRLELANPDLRLPAGTQCTVKFPIEGE